MKHIKLGENFLSKIDNMSENLDGLLKHNKELNLSLCSLNWKINFILVNKIIFYYQGIEFTTDNELK